MPRAEVAWTGDEPYERRLELYRRAIPILRRHGYRNATMKALAHACGLSIPALYRYFPSKKAFALFPLVALFPELHAPPPAVDAPADPFAILAGWIDAAAEWLPFYTVALRLSWEIGLTAEQRLAMSANLDGHAAMLAEVARRASPRLSQRSARELGTAMISTVGGPAETGIVTDAAILRRQLRRLLRGYGITLRGIR